MPGWSRLTLLYTHPPPSVQMGSPTPIGSAGDLTPMQVDQLLGLFTTSMAVSSHWVWCSNCQPPSPPVLKLLVVAEEGHIVELK
jgi:hypothetical protein